MVYGIMCLLSRYVPLLCNICLGRYCIVNMHCWQKKRLQTHHGMAQIEMLIGFFFSSFPSFLIVARTLGALFDSHRLCDNDAKSHQMCPIQRISPSSRAWTSNGKSSMLLPFCRWRVIFRVARFEGGSVFKNINILWSWLEVLKRTLTILYFLYSFCGWAFAVRRSLGWMFFFFFFLREHSTFHNLWQISFACPARCLARMSLEPRAHTYVHIMQTHG